MAPSVYQHTLSLRGRAFGVFRVFRSRPRVFFLDSSLRTPGARFSYIGFAPFTTVRGGDLAGLKKEFDKHRLPRQKLSFPAGAVGYLGYDGSLCFGFYDTVLTIDHQEHKLIISSFSRGRIKDILKELYLSTGGGASPGPDEQRSLNFQSNFTRAGYMKAVRQALEHIRRGDIYQINLSHQIKVHIPDWQRITDPAAIYGHLRRAFPSEYGAYLDDGERVILSASPERFLRLHNGTVQVKPMKGTRPRGKTKAQDRAFKEELIKSPKEIAELLMVTDLERNDLGRVCDYASVRVRRLRTIETYRSVFQATSTVEGRLHKARDQFDLLKAAFPSGSVTGCPKIEAMKTIEKLEHGPRGLYTGALGYISFSGDMDFNVIIRALFLKPHEVTFHVGGGIVADSRPAAEWQETWDKAGPLMETLRRSFS
ncbi:MAG: aminodeoxychorismate synthase component I [Candidatus Omnitrophica bacterium]|nr:aminodeoxychorismate synthase component I [Candidatus Omnitrophota bacterium]